VLLILPVSKEYSIRQAQVTEIKLNEDFYRYEVSIEVFYRHGDIAVFTSAAIFPDADYALAAGYSAVNTYKATGRFPNMSDLPVEA
jgi:hypothetical protein